MCTDSINESSLLLVDGNRGIYGPQEFALRYLHTPEAAAARGVDPEAAACVLKGPDPDEYWLAWAKVVDTCRLTIKGREYFIEEDAEGIFASPADIEPEGAEGIPLGFIAVPAGDGDPGKARFEYYMPDTGEARAAFWEGFWQALETPEEHEITARFACADPNTGSAPYIDSCFSRATGMPQGHYTVVILKGPAEALTEAFVARIRPWDYLPTGQEDVPAHE